MSWREPAVVVVMLCMLMVHGHSEVAGEDSLVEQGLEGLDHSGETSLLQEGVTGKASMKQATKAKVAINAIDGCAHEMGELSLKQIPALPKLIIREARKPAKQGTGVSQLKTCLLDSHGMELTYDWTFKKDGMFPERIMAKWFSPTGKEDAVFKLILQIGADVSKACVVLGGPYPITKSMKMLGPKMCLEITMNIFEEELGEDGSTTMRPTGEYIRVGEKQSAALSIIGEPMVRLKGLDPHPSQTALISPNPKFKDLKLETIDLHHHMATTKITKTFVDGQPWASEVTHGQLLGEGGPFGFDLLINIEFALVIDVKDPGNELTIIAKASLEIGRLVVLGWLQYIWCNPFGFGKGFCLGNLEVSVGVSLPPLPPISQLGGGAVVGLGKDCAEVMKANFAGGQGGSSGKNCGHGQNGAACAQTPGKSCNMASLYIGIDLISPDGSYFAASFTKIMLGDIFGWLTSANMKSLKHFMDTTGFPKGLSLSFSNADIDIMGFTINSGHSFAGTLMVLGWAGSVAFRIEELGTPKPPLFTFECHTYAAHIGGWVHLYRNLKARMAADQTMGPMFSLVIQFLKYGYVYIIKEMPKIHIEAYLTMACMGKKKCFFFAYAKILMTNNGLETVMKGGIFGGLVTVVQRQEVTYPKGLDLTTARVAYEFQISLGTLKKTIVMMMKLLKKAANFLKNGVKRAFKAMKNAMKKVGLGLRSFKEEVMLVYAEEAARKKLRRERYEASLGETKRSHDGVHSLDATADDFAAREKAIPRCCEGTPLGEGTALGLMDAQKTSQKWGAVGDFAKKAGNAVKKAGNAVVETVSKPMKMIAALKKTFQMAVNAAKGMGRLLKTLLTKGPFAILQPCGASFGGELSGAKIEVMTRFQALILGHKETHALEMDFLHPIRTVRRNFKTFKSIILAFFKKGQGRDKCDFKVRGVKKQKTQAKSKIKPNEKMPNDKDLASTKKPLPPKGPKFNTDGVPESISKEDKQMTKDLNKQDITQNKKEQKAIEKAGVKAALQTAQEEEEEAKKLLEDAMVKKKSAEASGGNMVKEVKEKTKILSDPAKLKKLDDEAGISKLKIGVSPLKAASDEEKPLIEAFIAGYHAGLEDAKARFPGTAVSPGPTLVSKAEAMKPKALSSTKEAFQAGYATSYGEVARSAKNNKRVTN